MNKQYIHKNESWDYEIQCMLGGCYHGSADAGEVLSTAESIRGNDAESWYQAWLATAERVRLLAEKSAAAGHDVSARRAYLRAATYFSASIVTIDGTKDPSRREPTWKRHLHCFDEFCKRLAPAAEKVSIPYENTPLPGYFFKPAGAREPLATIIFNNGSDAPTCALWGGGVAGALERGYAALIFDGPGQNAMLWLHKVPFRHDWEKVITPVVDYLLTRKEVDPRRIALSGLSQGGYWILRALAFEHRIAAGIADPGVMDVFAAFASHLPKSMLKLLDNNEEEKFNQHMEMALHFMGKTGRQNIRWRMTPYGTDNFYRCFKQAQQFHVREVIGQIRCPMLIADPEDEQFWPGQSQQVYDALQSPKTLVRFTAEEGANGHCEPKARSLYDQRMFDGLAEVMPPSTTP